MKKRLAALCLAVMMLTQVAAAPAQAAKTVYFTSINDNVLPLSDGTMAFWHDGFLYVDSSIFSTADNAPGKPLDIYRSRNDSKQILVLTSDGRSLIFDLAKGTVEDNQGMRYNPGTIRRGKEVFVPVSVVASFFNLTYSSIRVESESSYQGYLVWIRNDKASLTDEKLFANAATYQMELRYARHARKYALEESVRQAEEMFRLAIEEQK